MTDEKFLFVTDMHEKKRTARGIHNKRTHTGKGGRVRFPSDNLTRKELNAMNGEVKSYNINNPMKWAEFKALPDDIKTIYVKAIREKFRVSDCEIFRMLGVPQATAAKYIKRLGLGLGRNGFLKNPDIEGFRKWASKDSDPGCAVIAEPVEEEFEVPVEVKAEAEEPVPMFVEKKPVVPSFGTLHFEGNVLDTLEAVAKLLGGVEASIKITWSISGDQEGCEIA